MAERLAAARMTALGRDAALPEEPDQVSLGIRIVTYLIDSVVLFAFIMLFALVASLSIFLRTDSGRDNPSDSALWTFAIILMLTVPAWLLVNLVMGVRRGQSVGQYVMGLQAVKESGSRAGPLRLIVYWLALHPLLFHPLLACSWLLFAWVGLSLSESTIAFVVSMALAILCLIGPPANLFFAFADPKRRTVHDRVAGMKVVRIG